MLGNDKNCECNTANIVGDPEQQARVTNPAYAKMSLGGISLYTINITNNKHMPTSFKQKRQTKRNNVLRGRGGVGMSPFSLASPWASEVSVQ